MTDLVCRVTQGRPLLALLLRGSFGILLLAAAASAQESTFAITALLAAFVVFGGCPMCWTLGLVELVSKQFKSPTPRKDAP